MAATVYLSESNGAGEVVTDNITNCNFGGVDLVNLTPATHPIVRPNTTSSFRSFLKEWRIKVANMDTSLLINDFRFWKSSGALVAGELMGWFSNSGAGNAYVTPDNSSAFTMGAVPTSDPGSSNINGSISAANNYAPSNTTYLRFQFLGNQSGITTPIGAVNQKTFVFSYAES